MSRQVSYSTAQRTTIASSATAVPFLPARSRFGGVVWNRSTQILYLLLKDPNVAEVVSATVHSVELAAGAYWNLPEGYAGAIDAIWVSANADAQVTEYR